MVPDGSESVANQQNKRQRSGVWPLTIATALVFVCLVSLGVWQLKRLAWKEGLIADLTARQAAAPIALADALRRFPKRNDLRFLRVRATGTFLHQAEKFYYKPDPKLGPGFDVMTPFFLSGGKGVVMVNRGYVPEPLRAPAKRREGQLEGPQEIVGIVRLPGRQAAFTPDNDPENNLWFWRDFDAMFAGVPVTSDVGPRLALFIDAEASAPGGWPRGGKHKIELSNRHFGYAITWFGLALTLLGVYSGLMWTRYRK